MRVSALYQRESAMPFILFAFTPAIHECNAIRVYFFRPFSFGRYFSLPLLLVILGLRSVVAESSFRTGLQFKCLINCELILNRVTIRIRKLKKEFIIQNLFELRDFGFAFDNEVLCDLPFNSLPPFQTRKTGALWNQRKTIKKI